MNRRTILGLLAAPLIAPLVRCRHEFKVGDFVILTFGKVQKLGKIKQIKLQPSGRTLYHIAYQQRDRGKVFDIGYSTYFPETLKLHPVAFA